MPITRRGFLAAAAARPAPEPVGAVPSARQLKWHALETSAFLHFTVNTFTDREWGYGDEDPRLFHPTAFDADAIVAALAAGGMKGVILTCKHHDGFCLWPTRTTAHSVSRSPWRDGKGDVVREISNAARRQGLKFGVYLSPWDRNHPQYGGPGYVEVYREQLRELLTGYGPVFEVWHDGANGGDGYYGGAREKRLIDKRTYYDWPRTWEMVRKLQPDAVIFSDAGPDIRWVGNEKGVAGETCWATYDPGAPDGGTPAPGFTRSKEGGEGHRNGSRWMPAECDVSIRPGWFWHENQNGKVKPPRELLDLYYRSVGRGAGLLLNVPPDRRGLLHENDVASLKGFGDALRATFARDLARDAERQDVDGTGREIVLYLKRPEAFNVVRLREDIRYGQRVGRFVFEVLREGVWRRVADGNSMGFCRLLRLGEAVRAERVRLLIEESSAPPTIGEFGLYAEPAS